MSTRMRQGSSYLFLHESQADTATQASDLHMRYNDIFPHHNRNAASHLWS